MSGFIISVEDSKDIHDNELVDNDFKLYREVKFGEGLFLVHHLIIALLYIPGITRGQVGSHLQKYQKFLQ